MYLNNFLIAMTFIDGIFVLTNLSRGYRSEIRLDTYAAVSCSVFHDLIVMLEFLVKFIFGACIGLRKFPLIPVC